MDSNTSVALVPIDRRSADGEGVALAGFLAGYRGSTREAYALDLRQFAVWCATNERRLFEVHRVDIECFGRDLESRGRARATIARRLCTIAGFYRYAEEEGLIEHSPAIHVRRPRIDYESHASGLDRNELGALLVAAGLSSARDHALVSLLALNGLRISEALGADVDALGLERGHRTLTVTRKGGSVVTMPLAPRVARALDLAIGERLEGPIFVDVADQRLDRHAAGRIVRRIARQASITKRVGPHTLRHAFITAALDAGVPLRDVQEAASHADPRTTMRYDRGRQSLDRHATYIVATFVAGALPLSFPIRIRTPESVGARAPDRAIGARGRRSVVAAPWGHVTRSSRAAWCAQTAASTSRTSTVLTVTPSGASGIGGSPTRNMAAAVRASSSVSKTTMATPRPP